MYSTIVSYLQTKTLTKNSKWYWLIIQSNILVYAANKITICLLIKLKNRAKHKSKISVNKATFIWPNSEIYYSATSASNCLCLQLTILLSNLFLSYFTGSKSVNGLLFLPNSNSNINVYSPSINYTNNCLVELNT